MRLKYYPVKKFRKEVLVIIGKRLDLGEYKVFFFGSRPAGKGDERSDIDIGIEGPKKIPLKILNEIREKIAELPILYKVDVVDFKDAPQKFKEIARRNIKVIK